ncbi:MULTISPECIES: hypothetical protein [Vibrio]|uniref:hypothetical protein n=1 Tax=Vibrio TaxID=662 RepID=UPI0010BDB728|nr:hypothetical protein [Vibrio sp. F12]TKE73452.1 hypothetical protein FCV54_24990 [Vibrio sp. F12]
MIEIYDLTRSDLEQHPVWYFPMDDTVGDELTIKPLKGDDKKNDYQLIVRTSFTANDGTHFVGYIYWCRPENIESIQPVVFVNDEDCITFWNGVTQTGWDDYGKEQKKMRNKLPLKYSSDAFNGLESLSGVLEGLYYLNDEGLIVIS